MDPNEFFASLPRGKEDKPSLFTFGDIVYDHHDIDGLYAMLDKDFSGCVMLMFSKPMNNQIQGTAAVNGRSVKNCFLKFMPIMNHLWVLGVRVRGLVREYGKEYNLHVEGFVDEDGNEMKPQDFMIKSPERTEAREKDVLHEAIALQAAEEGIVLLENQNQVLPIKEGVVLNLFGKAIHEFRTGAVGAGKINPRYVVDFLEALEEERIYQINQELVDFYGCDEDLVPGGAVLQRAKALSDTAVVMITRGSGENQDNSSQKGDYYLSDQEEQILEVVSGTFSHIIVVLNTAYPIDVNFVQKYQVEGVILLGLAGMFAGKALLNVISGRVNPSGKLPDTWARDYFDIPSSQNFYNCADKPQLTAESSKYVDTVYEEDIYVGYRYFTTFGKKAAYPFGYGLSYTGFRIKAKRIQYEAQSGLHVLAEIMNTGKTAGKEVVQIYVGQPDGEIEKPERVLVEFGKTKELQPGETEIMAFTVKPESMTSYSEAKAAYLLEAGVYQVYVGADCQAKKAGEFQIQKEIIVKQVRNRMKPAGDIVCLSRKDPEGTWPKGEKSGVKEGVNDFEPKIKRAFFQANFNGAMPAARLTYADVRENPELAEDFVAQMSPEELARISVCGAAGWGMEGVGEAGRIFKVDGYGLPDFPVCDGNSGVNLNIKNIGMPSGVTICASFNRELSEEVGRVIGEEAKALDIPMILAPALNIHRNPLNGRQPEYFSEDPYLAGVMAGSYAKGLEESGVASCMKHLLANNCESSRKRNMSILTERAIREIYFRVFEIAMGIHMPAAVMTAYNACNGVPTAADEELLQGLLREENGFDGFVMTDWGTYDTVDVAQMIQAGNCWITPGSLDDTYTAPIMEGLEAGTIALSRLKENVTWIIRTLARFVS